MIPRLYPILDSASLARKNCGLEAAAAAMLEGGARILQLRHKGHWGRSLFEQAERVARLCAAAGVPLVIDDRADVALLLGAGVHVGQDDLSPSDARRILGPDAILGFSTHNPEQLAAAAGEPVTYLAIGPVYATTSKQNPDPVVGLDILSRPRTRPLVAIGGITRENARAVIEAGADSVAVISDLLPDPCTPPAIRSRMEEWQRLLKA
jgi:thiamine-phosphate pyrophosphorylase